MVFLEAYMKKVQEISKTDISIVTRLYEGIQDYMVTNMGADHFAKLLEASNKNQITNEKIQAEGFEVAYFDVYHVDDDQLYDLIIRTFYVEVN